MKRLLIALSACLALTLAVALPAGAAPNRVDVLPICQNIPSGQPTPSVCQDNQTATQNANSPIFGPHGIVTIAIQLLTLAAGIIIVFVIIISGVRFITSSGDPNSVTQARNGLLYGVIGLAIVAAAQGIVTFILSKL